MRITLFGKGKMAKVVQQIAQVRDHQIVALENADICIDFSHPDAAIENLKHAAKHSKNVVMGTTGWYSHMNQVEKIVAEAKIGFLWAANFSLGVWLFTQAVAQASKLFNAHPNYDVSIMEIHHRQKADAPSGTAKVLGQAVLNNFQRKKKITAELTPDNEAIHISSVRCGANPGQHTVIFDSSSDTITLNHQSHNRESFALGAILAAEWLNGKQGFFTIDDMMKEIL